MNNYRRNIIFIGIASILLTGFIVLIFSGESYQTRAQRTEFEFACTSMNVESMKDYLEQKPDKKYAQKIEEILRMSMYPDYTNDSGFFADPRDQRIYKWKRYGEQIWMAEDLKYDNGKRAILYTLADTGSAAPAGWRFPEGSDLEQLRENLTDHQKLKNFESLFLDNNSFTIRCIKAN
jgi:hypothetical protein